MSEHAARQNPARRSDVAASASADAALRPARPPRTSATPPDAGPRSMRLIAGDVRIQRRRPAIWLCGLTLAMSGLMFPPTGWWPLAFVCLIPWLICVCTMQRARFVYFVSYLLGFAFFALNVRWMAHVTWAGYLAMCVYFGAFFPLAAWPVRHAFRRRGVSLALAAPAVWVAVEYLRSLGPLGFPWLVLGHALYRNLSMIQISDLVGAYGVSFVIVMVNGALTDLMIQPIVIRRGETRAGATRMPAGSLTTVVVLAGTLIYGGTQRSTGRLEPGPKVAVVQTDFVQYVDDRGGRTPIDVVFDTALELARQAAAEKPDLIVLPETAWTGFINDEFIDATPETLDEVRRRRFPNYTPSNTAALQDWSRRTRDAIAQLSRTSGIPIVIGGASLEWKPTGIPPRVDTFNSAFLFTPDRPKPAARYDKIHLVLFGEYVPFRYTYRPLYEWLNARTPWGASGVEYSMSPGEDYTVFEFAANSRGRTYRAGAPICYEEIMPYVPRRFTTGPAPRSDWKNIDILLSISNDGWFHHSGELEQHLSSAVFRAIENRIAVARSVNTGTSALVDPNGKIHHRVTLSPQRIELLGPLEDALRRLREPAARMADAAATDAAAFTAARIEFLTARRDALQPALAKLGREFEFVDRRLGYLDQALSADGADRAEAAAVLPGQIDDDLAATARWREAPWTAPGYNIGELQCDARVTPYVRWGDWFSQLMAVLAGGTCLDWMIRRWRRGGRNLPAPAPASA